MRLTLKRTRFFAGCFAKQAALAGLALMLAAPAFAQKPNYGGNLEIGTVYPTISALSFDPADFAWKLNHDAGP